MVTYDSHNSRHSHIRTIYIANMHTCWYRCCFDVHTNVWRTHLATLDNDDDGGDDDYDGSKSDSMRCQSQQQQQWTVLAAAMMTKPNRDRSHTHSLNMEIVLFSLLVTKFTTLSLIRSFACSSVRSFVLLSSSSSSLFPLLIVYILCVLVFIFTFSELICAMQRVDMVECILWESSIRCVYILFCMQRMRDKEGCMRAYAWLLVYYYYDYCCSYWQTNHFI